MAEENAKTGSAREEQGKDKGIPSWQVPIFKK